MAQFNSLKKPYLLYLGDSTSCQSIKTAIGIAKWCPEHCVGEFSHRSGTASAGLPSLTLEEAAALGAKTLIIGVANGGGKLHPSWQQDIIQALALGLDVASGLHDKLNDNQLFLQLAKLNNSQLIDLRRSELCKTLGRGLRRKGKRLLTVGTDCTVGKMFTALAIVSAMKRRQVKAEFVATGQTGVFIKGEGICIDAVVADFMSGAVEALTPATDSDRWQVIEGQGSLFNPSYAGVSLALLHGSQPDHLVLCHEVGRQHIKDLADFNLPSFSQCIEQNIQAAKLTNADVKISGISLNTKQLREEEALEVIKNTEKAFNLPCFDPVRTGVENLIEHLMVAC